MKKILIIVAVAALLSSCQNNQKNEMLTSKIKEQRSRIERQDEQIKELDRFKRENADLKEKLNICMFGDPNKDVQKIGKWLLSRQGGYNTKYTLNKNTKTRKHYLTSEHDDGSSDKSEVRVTKEKGLTRFELIDNTHIEWFIIEKNGDLSFWSQNGKFATGLCM